MKPLHFQNPANQYVEEINHPFLGALLIGPLYIGLRGAWLPALAYTIITCLSFGVFWFVLPFLAEGIFRRHYLSQGWIEVDPDAKKTIAKKPEPNASDKRLAALEAEIKSLKSKPKKKAGSDIGDDGGIPTYRLD